MGRNGKLNHPVGADAQIQFIRAKIVIVSRVEAARAREQRIDHDF